MEEVLSGIDKVVLDGKVSDRMLPYLPLDRSKPPAASAATEEKKR